MKSIITGRATAPGRIILQTPCLAIQDAMPIPLTRDGPGPTGSGNMAGPRSVIVVGAGPVGLCAAIDLGIHGIDTLVLDQDDTLAQGSRAICLAKRTLEILDRLGCGERVVARGVVWNTGKVFLRDRLLYAFNLLPDTGAPTAGLHQSPAGLSRAIPSRATGRAAERGNALAQPGRRSEAVR
jgi:hypothetical protein